MLKTRSSLWSILAVLLLFLFVGSLVAAEPIPLEDFFKNPEQAYFQLSPDGKYISFTKPYKARKQIRRSLRRIEDVLYDALVRAQRDGALSDRADPRALAQFLLTQAQGLRLVSKTNPPPGVLENIVTTTLSVLR